MARLVRHFDNGDGQVNKDELREGLESFLGNDVAPDELEYLLNYFDKDHSGAISVDEFLHGIRGNLGGRRMHSVDMTFEHLDKHLDGYLTLNDIRAHYKADNHPKVLSGDITRHEALLEFVSGWDADENGQVTKLEFVDYFKDISVGIPDDQTFFAVMQSIFPGTSRPPSRQSVTSGGSRKSTARKTTPYHAPATGL